MKIKTKKRIRKELLTVVREIKHCDDRKAVFILENLLSQSIGD